jgi:hypothetical protein
MGAMDERIRCQACGVTNPPDSFFCESCGARIATAPPSPSTPPSYEAPASAPYAEPTPHEGRARPLRASQVAKSAVVGTVLVAVLFVAFAILSIIADLVSQAAIILMWFFLPGFVGTLLTGYFTASDIKAGAVAGGIAGGMIFLVFGRTTPDGVALFVGGVLGGAAGGYLKDRKLHRAYSTH